MKYEPILRLIELAEYSQSVASLCGKTDLEERLTKREKTMKEALEKVSCEMAELAIELNSPICSEIDGETEE
ncbi:hypothetical protein GZ77_06460 [Endozoicomonas montiporae]|uniref:Uncharacterized protein n=2 Tax=Endozoicomonas montiporae TaxID=1027273 RepID=A0A081NCC4_9GAMM|nr:hypothetical protein [Endozoicomonas montiporae]AMO56429.1 hypothetical protein EZMO1_2331 [Endozoicomonas montiporae CL-33]KEQ16097.1 hypothetical protein GZ77_06460 [Endozoicomonas montiporae]